ncbi:beta-ketoacyl-ACP reductase [Longimycelium tulufanense]|uniref:Beta-ketoacyl-ACP reductase n=1 Tax=Longimycelium tulufanense TaxID=907463 RepID=A0A8J3CBX8_9PSEU|nr:3-oxoacyl-ACP reductase family protein [Longimycelium tulufanense]GGM46333.1 beta-ketoacyl-ACP reductase [Longimycelium tulufanense]
MADVEGNVVLVTDATRGIGLAVAKELAGAGAIVLLNDPEPEEQAERALAEVRKLQPEARLVRGDVADPADIDRMFAEIRTNYGGLDGLVSNAGITADGYAVTMGEAKWRRVLDTNLTGAFLCCRAAARLMAGQRAGAIVVVSSTSATNSLPGRANYAASEAGLLAVVRVLAKELGGYGVRVNAVLPGLVETTMTDTAPDDRLADHLRQVPLARSGRPAEVASVVRFLLSERTASYVTGTSVVVDGGLTC